SNAYFGLNNLLRAANYNVYSPIWRMSGDSSIIANLTLLKKTLKIQTKLQHSNFNDLTSPEFYDYLKSYKKALEIFFKENIRLLIVPQDVSFFENIAIKVCKDLKIPTICVMHGMPGRYNLIDENRCDYLVVMNKVIKENYINSGFNPEKVIVGGHPYYKNKKPKKLKFTLENILVISNTVSGAHPSDGVKFQDRSNLIYYLYEIELVLKNLGVNKVRLRLHPSENRLWYLKFINNDFYIIDNDNLLESLSNSSLVIGPTSTVFLDALNSGINYTVFEPYKRDENDIYIPLYKPFDGSDKNVPVAKTRIELENILKERKSIKINSYRDYIKSMDLSFVNKVLNAHT
ncbi:MAG: hypothetical protein WD512_10185, partial [Candidatus Paceibacterota bacterium]